jgi:hypothetical protein
MKRRDFLRQMAVGSIATIAGLAAGGFRQPAEACSLGKHGHDHQHDGHDAVVEQEFKCRGRQVQILRYGTGADVEKVLVMDGQEYCEHVFSAVGDRYSSHLLCSRETRTARALVRRLVDNDGVLFKL